MKGICYECGKVLGDIVSSVSVTEWDDPVIICAECFETKWKPLRRGKNKKLKNRDEND